MSSTSVKPTPEELLRKLLNGFYIDDRGLSWGFKENISVKQVFDEEFEKQLIEYKDPDKGLFD